MKQTAERPGSDKTFRNKYLAVMIVVLALFSVKCFGQGDAAKYSNISGYGFKYKRMAKDSVDIIPLASSPHIPYRPGGIKYDPSDSTHILVWTGNQWLQVGDNGTGIDTAYYDGTNLIIASGTDTFNVDLTDLGSVDSVKVYKHAGTDSVYTKVNNAEAFSFVDNNNYPTSHTFNIVTGVLATQRNGGLPDISVDLDGRYVETLFRRNDSVFAIKDGLESFQFKDSTGGEIDVFLPIGQSNMVGWGDSALSPKVIPGTVYQWNKGVLSIGNDPIGLGYNPGVALTGSLLPAFGIEYNKLTGRRICFVQAAVSGTAQTIAANTGNGHWDTTGTLLPIAMARLDSAMADLAAKGYKPVFKGVLWHQGEWDAIAINSSTITQTTYINALRTMIGRLRTHYGANMPFYIFRIGKQVSASDVGYASIREAVQLYKETDSLATIVYYNCFDFIARGLMKDDFHYKQEGYNEMGRFGAQQVVNNVRNMWQPQEDDLYTLEGNVGIGTSRPNALLDVTGTGIFRNGTISSPSLAGGDNFSDTLFLSGTKNALKLAGTRIGPKLYVSDNSGNMGWGTTGPTAHFEINDANAFNTQIKIINPATNSGSTARLFLGSDSSTLQFMSFSRNNTTFAVGHASSLIEAQGIYGLKICQFDRGIIVLDSINLASSKGYIQFSPRITKLISDTTNVKAPITASVDSIAVFGAYDAVTKTNPIYKAAASALIAGSITGSGTANKVAKFTATTTLGNSLITDDGTNTGISEASPNEKLVINGNLSIENTANSASNNTPFILSTEDDPASPTVKSALFIYPRDYDVHRIYFGKATRRVYSLNFSNLLTFEATPTIDFSGDMTMISNGSQSLLKRSSDQIFINDNAFFQTLTLHTNGAERVRINSTGDVGIGTGSPSAKLHVSGSSLFEGGSSNTAQFTSSRTTTNSTATITNTSSGRGLTASSSTGIGIYSSSTDNTGILGISTNGNGVFAQSTASHALYAESPNSAGVAQFTANPSSTNTVHTVLKATRISTSAGASGIGGAIDMENNNTTGAGSVTTSARLISKLTTATAGAEVSDFEIWGQNTGTLARKFLIAGTGQITADAYGSGSNTGTPAYDIQTTSGGALIEKVAPKVYTALLTQTSTNAPTAAVLGTNSIGSIAWSRTGTGTYVGTLSSAFTANKTWCDVNWTDESGGSTIIFRLKRTGSNTVELFTSSDGVTGTDVFTNLAIEIRVYP